MDDATKSQRRIDSAHAIEPMMKRDVVGYLQLYRLAAAEPFDPHAAIRLLSGDERIAARLLTVTNSLHFGLSRRIETVQHAVVLLGASGLRTFCQPYLQFATVADRQPLASPLEPASSSRPFESGPTVRPPRAKNQFFA